MQEKPAQSYIDANVQPPNLHNVNWKAAPLCFKLYRNCSSIPCTYDAIRQPDDPTEDDLTRAQVGQILSDIYGFTRQWHMPVFSDQPSPDQEMPVSGFLTQLLRPVPSGGALSPCELYLLVGPEKSFPAGIYHYDAAHHALDIIRQGNYSHLLQKYLAHLEEIPGYTLLLSCFFWKNGFKYGDFSYRLQGLDIGTVIAQSQVISSHYDLAATVHYQFLDRAIDDLIDLDPLHESIYAVITLKSTRNVSQTSATKMQEEPSLAHSLPTAELLESITHWPLPEALHHASLIETRDVFRTLCSLRPLKMPESIASQSLCASDAVSDLWEARSRRHSMLSQFKPLPITEQQLVGLLIASTRGYANDIDGQSDLLEHTLLYCVVNHVQNIAAGIYYYHPQEHVLKIIRTDNVQRELQEAQRGPIRNLSHASVCLLPIANYKQGFEVYGDRWYRMQNMEAGIIVQRLYLAAAALRLGCRASLGYLVPKMDELLCLPKDCTSLIQVMIGPEQPVHQHYEQSLVL